MFVGDDFSHTARLQIDTLLVRSVCKHRKYVRGEMLHLRCLLYAHSAMFHILIHLKLKGQDSSVGIAAHYGLDGLGIESGWRQDFLHPSRPALGPIQPPI
jgi:hypothetical protein